MTIKEIIAQRNMLIPETTVLRLLKIRNCEDARQMLRNRLPYHIAMLPRQAFLYAVRDVDKLKADLAHEHTCKVMLAHFKNRGSSLGGAPRSHLSHGISLAPAHFHFPHVFSNEHQAHHEKNDI